MNIKQLAFKLYKLINCFPLNNRKHGKLDVVNAGSRLINCRSRRTGTGNKLIFHRGGVFRNCEFIFLGNNNIIEFGEKCAASGGSFYIEDSNNTIVTGDSTDYAGKIHIACTESTNIKVGDNCLFSSEIVIRSGDSHSVINSEGKRSNHAKDVTIRNHVWVGFRALITKGALIQENSVVGTGAIVTDVFEEGNVVLAGVPAKIVKRDINWITERV